jgi:predicted membrane protein
MRWESVFGDSLALLSAVVGALLPLPLAIINQTKWPSELRGLVTLLISLLVATLLCWLMGAMNSASWFLSALIVFFTAVIAWHVWYRPSGIGPDIERVTSV